MAVKASATVTLSSVVDVKSVWRYYKLQASTLSKPSKPTTNPPSGWTTTEPSYTDGSTNSLYFCDLTVFCDNSFTYSDVSLSSSYEAAKAAYNKAKAAEDTAKDAKDTVDNMEIGGRNLFKNTAAAIVTSPDVISPNYYIASVSDFQATAGKQCVISAEIEMIDAVYSSRAGCEFSFNKLTSGYHYIGVWYKTNNDGVTKNNIRTRIYNVFTMPDDVKNVNDIAEKNCYIQGYISGTIIVRNVKLELGNKPTDWTPAPEDMATADDVNKLVTRVTAAETSITNNTNEIKLKATKTEVTEAIDNIQVGARNLLVGTSTSVIHTGTGSTNQGSALYEMSDYYNSITKLQGRQLTLSFDWETTATSGKFLVQLNDSPWSDLSEWITPSSSNKSGKSVYTAICYANFDTGTYTGIKIRSDNLTGTVTIKNAMLELGNKASSWQPAPEDVESDIDGIQVGGRNLLINTNTDNLGWQSSAGNGTLEYSSAISRSLGTRYDKFTIAKKSTSWCYIAINDPDAIKKVIREGGEFTLSFDVFCDAAVTISTICIQNGNGTNTVLDFGYFDTVAAEWTKIVLTGKVKSGVDYDAQIIYIDLTPLAEESLIEFSNIKLEKGNKATDWTPAPEDMLSTADAAETYTTQTEFTQTSEEIRMDFTKSIASASNDLQSQMETNNTATNQKLSEINKYIRFVDGKIVLGETGNELMLTIQNDRVSFTQSGVEVAYFSNNNLYVKRAEVLTTMKIGNYEFAPRNDGGLALRKRSD